MPSPAPQPSSSLVERVLADFKAGSLLTFELHPATQELVLMKLNFSEVVDYTEQMHAALLKILSRNSSLITLAFIENHRLTDTEVVSLIEKFPGLKSVILHSCVLITGKTTWSVWSYPGIIAACAARGVKNISLKGNSLDISVLSQLRKHYEGKNDLQIVLTPSPEWPVDIAQNHVISSPTLGLLMREVEDTTLSPVRKILVGGVTSIRAFTSIFDEKFISAGEGGIDIWDASTGKSSSLASYSVPVISVKMLSLPNSPLLLCGLANGAFSVWHLKQGKHLFTLNGHTGPVNSVIFLRENFLVASGSADSTIRIWNIKDRSCVHILRGHFGSVRVLRLLPNAWFVSAGDDGQIRVWDRRFSNIKTLFGHTRPIHVMIFLENGYLASGSLDGTIKIWDVVQGICLSTIQTGSEVHHLLAGKDNIKSIDEKGTLRIWELGEGSFLSCMQLTPNQQAVAAITLLKNDIYLIGTNDGSIRPLKPKYLPPPDMLSYSERLKHNLRMCFGRNKETLADFKRMLDPHWIELNLSNTPISDNFLIAILKFCPLIEILDLTNCGYITKACLPALIEHPVLREVKMDGNPYISESRKGKFGEAFASKFVRKAPVYEHGPGGTIISP